MRKMISALIALTCVLAATVPRVQASTNPCLLFGALATPAQDARFFAVDLKNGTSLLLGEAVPHSEVAGVAVDPATGVLYALLAPHGSGVFSLVTVDRVTGAVLPIGATGLGQASGLAVRPTDGTLWTWAQGRGPATIDPATGVAQVVAASNAVVTDLAWRPDGGILFAAGMRVLRSWDPVTMSMLERSQLPVTVNGLAMRADGRLLLSAPRPESGLSADAAPGLDRDFSLLILNPETGHIDATLKAPPIPLSTLPQVAASRVETLTWAVNCGNPSPGGPADLIQNVSVEPQSVCPGGTIRVVVETRHPEGAASPVNVVINGLPGADRWVQFEGLPGPRTVRVGASTAEGYHDAATAQADVNACDPSAVLPILRIRQDPYRPGVAAFDVQNADAVAPPGSTFQWEFGDGATAQGTVPFIRHSYAAAMPRDEEFPTFDAAVKVVRPDATVLRTPKTVALWNRYVDDKRRGVIRPPVEVDEVVPLAARAQAAVQSMEPRSAAYTLRNVEDRPIILTRRQVEWQPCDPDLSPSFSDWEQLDLEVAPGASITQSVVLPDDEGLCGVAVHLIGTAGLLHRVAADVYFAVRLNPFMQKRVSDGATIAALNAAAPLLSHPDRISEEDLFQLSRERRIPHPDGGEEVPPPTSGADGNPYVGQACLPDDPAPYEGLTCQPVPGEWDEDEPYIFNALKGDVILSTVCGFVGELLRAVNPPQFYSHSGIMTSNHYRVAHSTASFERYLTYPEGGGDLTNGIRGDVLQYGWPGVIQQSIGAAYGAPGYADHRVDPDGASFNLAGGFSQFPALCPADEIVTYPLVVRPPAEFSASVRPMLQEAAEIAKSTQRGNYRLYAYTDSRIALSYDPPFYYYGPAAMCSDFVWRSLTLAGVPLEGPVLEPEDVQNDGASLNAGGLMDGLYAYDAFERLRAGFYIHNSISEQVETQAGWFGDAVTDAADDLANQFTNCFASDWCSYEAKDSEAWVTTGAGLAVSPHDITFWDSPATGGAYGSREPLAYRIGYYVPVYQWARSEGTGDVRGVVVSNGAPVEGARVVLDPGGETSSLADGTFLFLGVSSGNHTIYAEKQLSECERLEMPMETVNVPENGMADATLTLAPPSDDLRRVTFQGPYHIVDDEYEPTSDESEDGNFYATCDVSPSNRVATIAWQSPCVGAEVVVKVSIICSLQPDDRSVQVLMQSFLYEQSDCDPTDLDDFQFAAPLVLPAGMMATFPIELVNDDDLEPDWSSASIPVTATNGKQGSCGP